MQPVLWLLLLVSTLGGPTLYEYKSTSQLQKELDQKQAEISFQSKLTKLQSFFHKYNSPLEASSADFIRTSDKYSLDYRILVGIAGAESTFETRGDTTDFNPFGFGCSCNTCCIRFRNYSEAIESLASTLSGNRAYAQFQETKQVEDVSTNYLTGNKKKWVETVKYFVGML